MYVGKGEKEARRGIICAAATPFKRQMDCFPFKGIDFKANSMEIYPARYDYCYILLGDPSGSTTKLSVPYDNGIDLALFFSYLGIEHEEFDRYLKHWK